MLEIEQDRCRGVLYGRTEKQEMNQVSSSKGLQWIQIIIQWPLKGKTDALGSQGDR